MHVLSFGEGAGFELGKQDSDSKEGNTYKVVWAKAGKSGSEQDSRLQWPGPCPSCVLSAQPSVNPSPEEKKAYAVCRQTH